VTGRPQLGAATRVLGVIGDPVTHSRSPAMHNAALEALGLDAVYVAFPVPRGRGIDAVRAMATLGIAGLNVTMPHKEDAAFACDVLSPAATALRSANSVVLADDGRVHGESTDGEGFLRALADEGHTVAGRDVLVVGAGGAARAIVRAVGDAGGRVTVAARRVEKAQVAAGLTPGAKPVALEGLDVAAYGIVVQATPVGMRGEPAPFATEGLGPGQFVYDTVYPGETPLVAAARARGAGAVNGIGMLVHQGAIAFELFTGRDAPLDVMRAAAGA
jgi:shikimate dehydrogenase